RRPDHFPSMTARRRKRPAGGEGNRGLAFGMSLGGAIRREYTFLTAVLRTLGRLRSVKVDSARLATDDIEATVDKYPDRPAFIYEDRVTSYSQLDAYANRVAHWADAQGLQRGDTVALFMVNRP